MAESALQVINGTGAREIQQAAHDAWQAEQVAKQVLQPRSAFFDPTNPENFTGTRDKPTRIPFTLLRSMARIPPFWAIIQTRLNQVAQYARRPTNERRTGFRIALKDSERKMTPAERKMALQYEEFLLKTGGVPNKKRKDNFNAFLRKGIFDSLSLDAWTFEKVPTMRGDKLAEIWAIDAATIEFVIDKDDAPSNHPDFGMVYEPVTRRAQKDKGDIEYVQVIDGQVEAEYPGDELAYLIRNPKTDVRWAPFGESELEILIEIVTAVLNSVRYNSSYFTESHLPQGVLEIVGNYEQRHLEQFSRYWRTMTTGAAGKWKVPIMAMQDGQGLKFTNFKQSNKDMEFNSFLEFLLEIGCAVYQIDGAEVGFSSSKNRSVIQSDSTKAKIEASQDKGFVPLMEFTADGLNHSVIDVLNAQNGTEFALTWVGLNEEDEEKKWSLVNTRLSSGYSTPAMERKKNDEDVPEGPEWDWMNKPMNQVAAGYITGAQNQQMQQGQQDHEQNMANLNHKNAMEQADQKHQHAMAQSTFGTMAQGAQKAGLAEQANDHKLQQQTFGAMAQGAGENQKHQNAMEQNEQKAGHAMQQQTFGALAQGASEGQKHKNAMEQQEHAHGQNMEAQTVKQAGAMAQQKAGHANNMEQAEQAHGHQMLNAVMNGPKNKNDKKVQKSIASEALEIEIVLV